MPHCPAGSFACWLVGAVSHPHLLLRAESPSSALHSVGELMGSLHALCRRQSITIGMSMSDMYERCMDGCLFMICEQEYVQCTHCITKMPESERTA